MGPSNIIDLSQPNPSFPDFYPRHPTDPAQVTANVACRIILGILANLSIWVPLRILYRHGEFAAVVLMSSTMLLNILTIVNALIWRNDDTSSWWLGYGYCDVFPYVYNPLLMVYNTSIFAIMRHLADKISLMRADSPSVREMRRRNLIQALIIFPVPVVQMAWMYPLALHRYAIFALTGCTWMPFGSWPLLVFVILPSPLFAFGTVYYGSE